MKTIKKLFGIFIIKPFDFVQRYFKTFVFLLIVIIIFGFQAPHKDINANLAKIYLKGPIFESETFMAQIENLKNYPNIKGILLVIDSPGGTLAASVEIADIIKDLNESIPVVAYVQGTMASGSYYAGMYAHTIIANRGSMIGSIGVIFNGYNIKDLLDKVGIKSQSIAAGEFKEVGTFTREWNIKEKEYLEALLKKQYNMFITDVANARNINPNDYMHFAEGKIFSAHDALKLGLIDIVGSQVNAINILMGLSGVNEVVWAKGGLLESYLEKLMAKAISQVFLHLSNIQ